MCPQCPLDHLITEPVTCVVCAVPNRIFASNITVISNATSSDPVLNASLNRGGLFPTYVTGVHGPADNFVPPVSFWASPAGSKAGGGALYAIPSGMMVSPSSNSNASRLNLGDDREGFIFMMQNQ